jgi:hypothetical protein
MVLETNFSYTSLSIEVSLLKPLILTVFVKEGGEKNLTYYNYTLFKYDFSIKD